MGITSDCNLKFAEKYTCTSIDGAVKLRIGAKGPAAKKPVTVVEFFQDCCTKNSDSPALSYEDPAQSKWITITYAEYARKVEQAALKLLHLGLQPHDTVGILAHNCPEWVYCQFGTICAGGVIFGIYPTSSVDAVQHMLSLTGATICIVDTDEQMNKVRECQSQLPKLRTVIQLRGPYADLVGTQEGYYRWDELNDEKFNDELKSELKLRQRNIYANECAILVFTSGTSSLPKAVMLSHDGLTYSFMNFCDLINEHGPIKGNFVSYLPLCHMAAQFFEILAPLFTGGCTYFADKEAIRSTLVKTLVKVKPTLLFGVPRMFEKIQESVLKEFGKDICTSGTMDNVRNEMIKKSVGLENCKALICSGAPMTRDLLEFFIGADLPICNTYGSSEAGGLSINFERNSFMNVGPIVKGMECKLDGEFIGEDHGEICFRGRGIFMGYLNAPQTTAEAIDEEGWFHTGDTGFIDSAGNINITGRIKEMIITSGGENIPPLRIEELLKHELPALSNAMVVGDNRKYLTVLLTLKTYMDPQTGAPLDTLHADTKKWLQDLDLKYEHLTEVFNIPPEEIDSKDFAPKLHAKIIESIESAIKRTNSQALSRPQQIKKFAVLPHDFSTVTEELGPTLKLRRKIVAEKYKNIIDRMYD